MVKPNCPLNSTSHRITAVSKTEIVLYGEEVSESESGKKPLKIICIEGTQKTLISLGIDPATNVLYLIINANILENILIPNILKSCLKFSSIFVN